MSAFYLIHLVCVFVFVMWAVGLLVFPTDQRLRKGDIDRELKRLCDDLAAHQAFMAEIEVLDQQVFNSMKIAEAAPGNQRQKALAAQSYLVEHDFDTDISMSGCLVMLKVECPFGNDKFTRTYYISRVGRAGFDAHALSAVAA